MALKVAVYASTRQRRSHVVGSAMAEGIRRHGDIPIIYDQRQYIRPEHDIAVFYGFEDNLPKILREYREVGRPAVVIDLGYWERKTERTGKYGGYHKISVNDRHPTAYFQKFSHDDSRARALGLEIQPWRQSGRHILLAGMSDRAAAAENLAATEWELAAIASLAKITDRPIVYRPKPSWKGAKPLPGADYSPATVPIEQALENCHAVVTHHSNVAVDGLLLGVPAFVVKGVALPICYSKLGPMIEDPLRVHCRQSWLNDISWSQWSVPEMNLGLPWAHLKQEGLIP